MSCMFGHNVGNEWISWLFDQNREMCKIHVANYDSLGNKESANEFKEFSPTNDTEEESKTSSEISITSSTQSYNMISSTLEISSSPSLEIQTLYSVEGDTTTRAYSLIVSRYIGESNVNLVAAVASVEVVISLGERSF